MMIRCCLFLIAIVGTFQDARAQQQQPDIDSSKIIAQEEFLRILRIPAEVAGRANLFTAWQQGEVFLSQGRFASGIVFNYDMLNNVLLVLIEGEEFSLNPIAVDSIIIANSSQDLINPIILDGAGMDLLLLRVYHGPHLSLFRNSSAEVVVGDNNTTSKTELAYVPNNEIQIDREQMYFLLNKVSRDFHELQGNKKEIKNWENGDQVMDLVKNQNLDLRNETDLIRVVQYYEQLISDVQ